MLGGRRPADGLVSVRNKDTLSEFSIEWSLATADLIGGAAPWRTFRWYRGQKHYSGTYWSSTESSHVIYESRLELTRLLYADFDPAVRGIVAQPFLLKRMVDRRVRKHVPDFFLVTDQGPVVVDVKPRARLEDPQIRFTLEWTKDLVTRHGWRYEIWSEPPAIELMNVRFLAGFRNPACFDVGLVEQVRRGDISGRTLGEALSADYGRPSALVRSALFYLVWNQYFTVDVTDPLTRSSILMKGLRS